MRLECSLFGTKPSEPHEKPLEQNSCCNKGKVTVDPMMPSFPQNRQLPINHYPQDSNTTVHDAYDHCLQCEHEAGNDVQLLMYARCLGYLITEAPNDSARDYIAREILTCVGDGEKLNELARFYINHLFRLFRRDKGRTPLPSYHPSQSSSSGEETFFFPSTVNPLPKNHKAAKDAALVRDNYRCMATGCVDHDFYSSLSTNERIANNLTTTRLARTNFSHIFPPSPPWGFRPEEISDLKTHYAGAVWSIVNKYGHIDILNELNGQNGNRLSNGLTLTVAVREEFEQLCLWFEAIPNAEHTYKVCTLHWNSYAVVFLPSPRIVTFTTTTTDLELPDPRYLKFHATICRVAHLSDVARYLDEYDSEQEERSVLANDGSSAEYLDSRLQGICVT